jgi:hypothetical protein
LRHCATNRKVASSIGIAPSLASSGEPPTRCAYWPEHPGLGGGICRRCDPVFDVGGGLLHRDEALTLFEQATGARINVRKSMALPVGPWRSRACVRGIEYYEKVRILGVTFWGITQRSVEATWMTVPGHVKLMAQQAYSRTLCLAQRIRFVHTYLLAKIWYVAQLFPAPVGVLRQILTAISYFVWKGSIFKVPTAVLQAPKDCGGWNLTNFAAKCRTLYITCMYLQGQRRGSFTAAWLRHWLGASPVRNPLHVRLFPSTMCYLKEFVYGMADTTPPKINAAPQATPVAYRNSEVLPKLSRIPSSVEYTSIKT